MAANTGDRPACGSAEYFSASLSECLVRQAAGGLRQQPFERIGPVHREQPRAAQGAQLVAAAFWLASEGFLKGGAGLRSCACR